MADDRAYRIQISFIPESESFLAKAPELDLETSGETRSEAISQLEEQIEARMIAAAEGDKLPDPIDEEELDIDFPEDRDYDTLGGYIFFSLGKIPEVKESVSFGKWNFEVKSIVDNRCNTNSKHCANNKYGWEWDNNRPDALPKDCPNCPIERSEVIDGKKIGLTTFTKK